jgi:hypothetical protein
MSEPIDPEPLPTDGQPAEPETDDISTDELENAIDVTARRLVQAIDRLELGAEPYWMQDIRLAQKRIEAQRAELKRLRGPHPDS